MSGLSRVGDMAIGVCSAHTPPRPVTGNIIMGTPTVLTGGLPTATMGDTVLFDCGHTGTIMNGTSVCSITGKPIAMVGSNVIGSMVATIVLGAPTIIGN